MATKIFSSRADENLLAFADALARKEYGLSFGQYCGTILLESIERSGCMPKLSQQENAAKEKKEAARFIKDFALQGGNREIAVLSDEEIRELIASRYE